MILAPATPQLNVVYKSITLLAPYPYNARTHFKAQIRKIAESIRSFGFTNPVLIDGENTIVAGHGRVDAARLLGIEQVPTILLDTLTKQQIRAYVIADNRLALDAGWDPSILRIELQNLVFENEIDISLTGFEVGEIDLIVNAQDPACDGADNIPEEQPITVTQLGDLWQLAEHRVLCGDARAESAFVTLMGGLQASVIFSDPPYNVAIEGHASGNGNIHHPEFAMACGEMDEIEFTAFLTSVLGNLARSSKKGSVHYICMDWRHLRELLAAGYKTYDSLLNVCVWVKNTGGMGSFYRSQFEMIMVFRNGNSQHRNNVKLGKYGRNRTNVWKYPGANTLSRSGEDGNLLAMHPTVKPVTLIADALLDCSARGEIVLDSFLGSGSTLLAATRVGRICYGMELDPQYVDLAIRRWQQFTGENAVHVETTKTFAEVQDERGRSDV